jgi:hypothetical protein
MEGVMLSFRIAVAGALMVLFAGMTAGGAAAQTAASDAPGKPLQLLQIAAQPSKLKAKSHTKLLAHIAMKTTRKSVAEPRQPRPSVQTVAVSPPDAAATPENIWPSVNSFAPASVTAPEPSPLPASVSLDQTPSELVVGGQTVQVAAADEVNEIDLAANAGPPIDAAPSAVTATAAPALNDMTPAKPKSDLLTNAAAQPHASKVGSASWIAQVLAALGGAVAAGSAAWFLIGAAPQRIYG